MTGPGCAIILNVDDYRPGLYARTRILRQAGFEVREASTGCEAVRLALGEQPDLVLLDVNLPDIDGFEVCRQIKANPRTASVLVLHLSATKIREGDRIRGLETGADGYLVEPIEPAELIANVHALLRMRRAEQAARAAAEEAERRRRETEVLAEVVRGLNASLDPDTVLGLVAAAARDLCRSDSAHVAIRDPATQDMALRYSVGEPPPPESGPRTMLDAPIRIGADVEGILSVVNAGSRPFRDREDDVLQRLADHAAIAIRNSRLFAGERAARAEAEAANRAKDEFLATVSHELRTPLAAMLGWVRLFRAAHLDEPRRARALESIERNARAQAQLIDDLLDVSRIISGQLRLETRPVELISVVTAALDAIRPAAEAKTIRLEPVLEPAAAWVSGDPDRLQQILTNLLSNAVKFTPTGGWVEVRLREEAGTVEIQVGDAGQGISPQFLPHVFDRFRQADQSLARAHGGLGLGLAIVRHLVELHGGTIHAESPGEGCGAIFTVRLPRLSDPPAEAPSATAASGPGEPGPPVRLDGMRVLLVEDDGDAREVLATILGEAGAAVIATTSAREALAALAGGPADVVISDIAMPHGDGYTLVREIRRLPADAGGRIPVLALSAFARSDDAARSLAAGFQAHLRKPVRPEELVTTIRRVVAAPPAG
jgi:signal transduction histidine kinase